MTPPKPLIVNGFQIARCHFANGGKRMIRFDRKDITPAESRALREWLVEAERWAEE